MPYTSDTFQAGSMRMPGRALRGRCMDRAQQRIRRQEAPHHGASAPVAEPATCRWSPYERQLAALDPRHQNARQLAVEGVTFHQHPEHRAESDGHRHHRAVGLGERRVAGDLRRQFGRLAGVSAPQWRDALGGFGGVSVAAALAPGRPSTTRLRQASRIDWLGRPPGPAMGVPSICGKKFGVEPLAEIQFVVKAPRSTSERRVSPAGCPAWDGSPAFQAGVVAAGPGIGVVVIQSP